MTVVVVLIAAGRVSTHGQASGTVGIPAAPNARVRADLPALVRQAIDQSATFRGLVAAIQATNGIVYVIRGRCRISAFCPDAPFTGALGRRRGMHTMVLFLASPSWEQGSDPRSLAAQRTLERAIVLAGPGVARLPIVLAATPPDGASDGVEAWVIREPDGRVHQIGVYRESAAFRCARGLILQNYQYLLKVASAIVHEAWHYNHGADETGAYDAQIAFLVLNGGSSAQVSGVRRARERIVTGHHPVERGR